MAFDLLKLLEIRAGLMGDTRGMYFLDQMRKERQTQSAMDEIFGAPKTKTSDGTITWNGNRQLPTGNVTALGIEQQGPLQPGAQQLPQREISGFVPEVKQAGIDQLRSRLGALPQVREAMISQMFAPPIVGKDRYIGTPGEGGVFDVTTGAVVPNTQITKTFKMGDTREVKRGNQIVTQEFAGNGQWNDIGTGAAFAPREAPETWRLLSDQEGAARGLPKGGSYEISSKGQTRAVVQPKQDAPTESQAKYAYNARRAADAMKKVQDIVVKNPDAATSWWLSATENSMIPGLDALGRATADADSQIVRNNMADAVDAVITLGTGAAYTQEQLKAARNSILPQVGEDGPVKADKYRKLSILYDQAKQNARSAGSDLPDISEFAPLLGFAGSQGTAAPKTQEDYDKLPSGAVYIDPDDGKQYRKP